MKLEKTYLLLLLLLLLMVCTMSAMILRTLSIVRLTMVVVVMVVQGREDDSSFRGICAHERQDFNDSAYTLQFRKEQLQWALARTIYATATTYGAYEVWNQQWRAIVRTKEGM